MKKTKLKFRGRLQNNTKKRRSTKKSLRHRFSKKSKKIQRGGGPDETRFKTIVNCVRKYNALCEYYRLNTGSIQQILADVARDDNSVNLLKTVYNENIKILVDPAEKQVIERKISEMYIELQKYNCGFFLFGKNPISIEDASRAVLHINKEIAKIFTTSIVDENATKNIERWFPTRDSNDHFEYLYCHNIEMRAIAFDALFGLLPTDESSPFKPENPPSWWKFVI